MAANSVNLQDSRVFISYPRGGYAHTWAEKVQGHLEALGARVWRDEASINEGEQNWYEQIEQAVVQSDVMVCIVSHDSDDCRWQKREMLRADERGQPVVPLRIESVTLPFAIKEKQPVEKRASDTATLAALAAAVHAAWQARGPAKPHAPATHRPSAPLTQQRQRELAYLNDLIHSHYSDRAARYVPVEGKQVQSRDPARALKGLRMQSDAILRAFGFDDSAHVPAGETKYADVLDAYRDLQQRPIRRLAVLGEPGAGKSFSLERIAVEYAERALANPQAPIPVLVALGYWTREAQGLQPFIESRLGELGRYFETLRDEKRIILLLDGINEIPPAQRKLKAGQIQKLAEDERFTSVVVSCREKDFQADFRLPFDTLTLQPLTPMQIHAFLHRAFARQFGEDEGNAQAEARFWQIAGGEQVQAIWRVWQRAGADWELFWNAEDVPRENPNVYAQTSGEQDRRWQALRFDTRNLMRLASNPYLLTVMMQLPAIPSNRAQLFAGFLKVLFDREREARERRHDSARVPEPFAWESALVELAETLQRAQGTAETDGAQTTLRQADWPKSLTPATLDFSIDASVLQRGGDAVRFSHQLLQEYLASRLFLDACRSEARSPAEFWSTANWWERTGWEVVAEIAGEACAGDVASRQRLIAWLSGANPDVASEVWLRLGRGELPREALDAISKQWLARMNDVACEPNPLARAAIGRAMGRFGLDRREGVGVLADGTPDIDWLTIPSKPFLYQGKKHAALPAFRIARYLTTNAQFQAFIDAGGYREDRWWIGLSKRLDSLPPQWDEPNSPRETVSWYEAMAFCRWLSEHLEIAVTLPTEQQWERVASGAKGLLFPWGAEYKGGYANCNEPLEDAGQHYVHRTSAVGLYPQGTSPDGVLDLAGNVWEWCLNEYDEPENVQTSGAASRVLRGGSWFSAPLYARAARRYIDAPDGRDDDVGFRVCSVVPIE